MTLLDRLKRFFHWHCEHNERIYGHFGKRSCCKCGHSAWRLFAVYNDFTPDHLVLEQEMREIKELEANGWKLPNLMEVK